jgi:hypothetical protein
MGCAATSSESAGASAGTSWRLVALPWAMCLGTVCGMGRRCVVWGVGRVHLECGACLEGRNTTQGIDCERHQVGMLVLRAHSQVEASPMKSSRVGVQVVRPRLQRGGQRRGVSSAGVRWSPHRDDEALGDCQVADARLRDGHDDLEEDRTCCHPIA